MKTKKSYTLSGTLMFYLIIYIYISTHKMGAFLKHSKANSESKKS